MKKLRVLIGGEYSGTIRDAFISRGHDAMSCDISPTTSPGPHHQGYWEEVESDGWDLAIFHRTCTFMANSGAKHIYRNMSKDGGLNEERWLEMGRHAWDFWNHIKAVDELERVLDQADHCLTGYGIGKVDIRGSMIELANQVAIGRKALAALNAEVSK